MNTKSILAVLAAMLMLSGIASAFPSSEGVPGGVILDETAITINLCTKMIPLSSSEPTGWGVCGDIADARGTFSYEPQGSTLKFNAEAIGLGGHEEYPEVADLALAGATQTTLRWSWTTPNKDYFISNIVTVKETVSGNIIIGEEEKISEPNERIQMFVTDLTPGTSYTITVQSVYEVPVGASDSEYSLIYYRDTDPANVEPSKKGYIKLDQASSSNGIVIFNGYQSTGGQNIPFGEDVNPRGKIWIVPTTELNEDGTLKWTGYGAGNTMTDYLFESDRQIGGSSPDDWLGGITYTYVPET